MKQLFEDILHTLNQLPDRKVKGKDFTTYDLAKRVEEELHSLLPIKKQCWIPLPELKLFYLMTDPNPTLTGWIKHWREQSRNPNVSISRYDKKKYQEILNLQKELNSL